MFYRSTCDIISPPFVQRYLCFAYIKNIYIFAGYTVSGCQYFSFLHLKCKDFIPLCSDFNNFHRSVSHQSHCCSFEVMRFISFWLFSDFRFIACFHKFHYVVCRCGFLYINLTWGSFSFLCFWSLWIAIFLISLKNPWSLSSNIAFAYYLFLGCELDKMIESHVSHSVLFSPFLFLSVL